MGQVRSQIFFDPGQVRKILRFMVAFIEAGENAKDLGRALRAQNCIGAGKPRRIEAWIRLPPQPRVMAEQFQFRVLRNIDAGVLQKGDNIVCGVAQDTILEVQDAHPGDAFTPGKPEEIWRMVVAERPRRPRGEDILNHLAPKIDKGRLGARGELNASDIGRVPVEQEFGLDGKRVYVIDWNPVGLIALDGQIVGKAGAVQICEPGQRNGVTFLDDAASAGNRLAAEILDDGETGGEIEGNDLGRRKALRAQPLADREERLYVPSEL